MSRQQPRLRDLLDRHPRAITAGVIGGALVLVAAAVVLAIGTFNPPPTADASPTPSASVNPSAPPSIPASPSSASEAPTSSSAPSSTPSPSVSTAFQYADILRVDVNGLAVRQAPSVTSPLVQGSTFDGHTYVNTGDVRLNTGEVVRVHLGSLPIDDKVWYFVQSAAGSIGWQGWVAAFVGDDQYLSLHVRPDPTEYNSWPPGGPQMFMVSGTGDYESGPQVQHDMFAFYWAVAAAGPASPCPFTVTLRPDDVAEPVMAVETSTSGIEQGPFEGESTVLHTPWEPSGLDHSRSFTVSVSSDCTWAVRLWPLPHD